MFAIEMWVKGRAETAVIINRCWCGIGDLVLFSFEQILEIRNNFVWCFFFFLCLLKCVDLYSLENVARCPKLYGMRICYVLIVFFGNKKSEFNKPSKSYFYKVTIMERLSFRENIHTESSTNVSAKHKIHAYTQQQINSTT